MSGAPNSWVNGKLGKAAHFEGNTANVIYCNTTEFNYTDNFSVALWVKPNYTGTAAQYLFTVGRADYGGYGYGLQVADATKLTFRFGNTYKQVVCNTGEWHHFVMYVTDSRLYVYKDGELQNGNGTATTLPTYSDGNGLGIGCFHYSYNIYPGYGDICDFRIYDHALSPREVKEISKGLVCHYTLNNGGGENLIKNSTLSNNTDSWIGGGTPLTSENTTYNSVDCWHVVGELQKYKTLTPYFTVNNTRNLGVQTAGNQYVLSMDVLFENVVKGTTNYYVTLYKSGETIDGTWRTPTVVNNSGHFTSTTGDNLDPLKLNNKGWQRVWIAVEFGDYNWSNANYVFQLYFRDFTGDIYVKNVKIEEGSVATPWTPNPTDPEYTKMGFDDGIEYDVSGYGHNGTKVGNITIDVDTPRYWTSSVFDGDTSLIKISDLNLHPMLGSEWTCAFWVYNNDNEDRSIFFSGYGFTTGAAFGIEKATSNATRIYWGGLPDIHPSGYTVPVNQWCHLAFVGTPTSIKCYLNGELKYTYTGTLDISKLAANTTYGIGRDSRTGATAFKGKMSDVRFYATCLSEADILALYNTPISLSSNGTLLTQGELTEV